MEQENDNNNENSIIFDKGINLINIGILWFIAMYVIALIIDPYSDTDDKGFVPFLIGLFINMPGTYILLSIGTNKLLTYKNRKTEWVKLLVFACVWFFIWYYTAITASENQRLTDTKEFVFNAYFYLFAMSGIIIIPLIARRLSIQEKYKQEIEESEELKSAEKWYNKGADLNELGQADEALEAYKKAIEIKPDYADAWFNRACIFSTKGNKETALFDLKKAINSDITNKETAKKDKDFEKLWNDKDFKSLVD